MGGRPAVDRVGLSESQAGARVDARPVFALVLTGPPGAGKTSVLTALVDALTDDDIPHAAVEVEALVWSHPAVSTEQWMRHVAGACALHRQAGHRLLLVADTIETGADLARLLDAIGADEHFVVRLEALPATLVTRIVEREPDTWSGLPALVAHARELAASMPTLQDIDLAVSTERRRPEAVAEQIRAALPDRLQPRGPTVASTPRTSPSSSATTPTST